MDDREMEQTFNYVRSTTNFNVYEAVVSPGLVQVIYIDKAAMVPDKIRMLVTTRNYSDRLNELDKRAKDIRIMLNDIQNEIESLKRKR